MSAPDLEAYNTRMRAHCEAAITGSEAMVADQISPTKVPYWLMQTNIINDRRVTRYEIWLTIESNLFLARGGADAGKKNEQKLAMLSDISTVVNYFHANPEFIVGSYTTNPAYFIGGSLRVSSEGQVDYTTNVGSLEGTLYRARWLHRQLQSEVS